MDYKPFLIQKLSGDTTVKDSKDWDIWIRSVPFVLFPDLKEVPSRSWPDEQGDDEFIPDTPFYKAYEMACEFVYIGADANTKIKSFLSYLSSGGAFKFYDAYTKIGRTDVRYVGFSDDAFRRRSGSDDIVIFKITLKVNDPISDIVLIK